MDGYTACLIEITSAFNPSKVLAESSVVPTALEAVAGFTAATEGIVREKRTEEFPGEKW